MRTHWNKAAAVITLAGSLAGTGCKRPEDQAAKARIFSPEQPIGAQAEAAEKLDAHKLGSDPALAERVIRMPQAEIAHRLGAHKTESKVSFDWTRGPAPLLEDGGVDTSNAVTLEEQAQLAQNSDGDFSVQLKNDHNQGFELVWAHGGAYARGLFGPFHKRRTDRTDPTVSREQALGSLATFDRLARGLKLRLVGSARSNGRAAIEYVVDGGGALAQEPGPKDLPPVTYPEPPAGQAGKALGADPDTARRLQLREKAQAISLGGHLFVDAETCAPLAAELTGRFRVPSSNASAPPSELNLAVSFSTSDVGRGVTVKVPAFEPDPSTPHGVKDPLRFMGKLLPASAPDTEEVEEPEEEDDATAPAAPASARPQKTKAPRDAP
jgi:hypothetical protein